AIQSRFEHTISNLMTSSENLSASRSQIRDADFASETAQMTKFQILQQAGISILSQANQGPQNTLSLLR
ncbi:flagellin, partial [Thiospirillum jenense]